MSDHKEILVEVEDLQVHFHLQEGVVRAVDGVSFRVYQGRTLGIIGESGSGKSVSSQAVMGILPTPPARMIGGKVTMHLAEPGVGTRSVVLSDLPTRGNDYRAIRGKEIGMIFQEPMTSFSPVHTIGNQIMEAILLHIPNVSHREAKEQAIEILRRVGIPRAEQRVDAYPHQFSGGMRQRAMIAMALACSPKLVIADEPTTALDVTIEAQILELLKDLQKELGMAIIYISHDLAVVGSVADEIMVMYLGLVMEHAPTDAIFDNPHHPYTQALLRSIPTIDGQLERLATIQGTMPSPFTEHPGCPFFSRCDQRVPGTCDVARPPLVEVEPGHKVRCVLYQ
ncbi:MAG TPA: ABC transporter ATP-binding protein [Caldilineaceae bacterium]|nr:ABC transporter ATP-binding protein [Caldilineaceae bacterium]